MRSVWPLFFCLDFLLLSTAFSYGQNWKALNPPLNIFNGTIYACAIDTSGNIYAGGDFTNGTNNRFVAKWDGARWSELGSGNSSLKANNFILTLATAANGSIYAAGGFQNSSGYEYVAAWNGSEWSELGIGATGLNASGIIYSIITDKSGNVYAAGNFTDTSGNRYVAKWDGIKWSELGTGANALNANNAIFAITADSSGNIYAGGYFTDSSGKEYVAKWNGTTWSETGTGLHALNANDLINCLATDNNGDVYAGGDFRDSSNQYYLARWNGSTWSETGTGTNALNANIETIAVKSSNEIYVGGYFNGVKKWDGTSWSDINNDQNPLRGNGNVNCLAVDPQDNVYAGGNFINISGHNFIAKWNGAGWSEPGSKGDPFFTNQPIYRIVADARGNTYLSGNFVDAGSNYFLEYHNGKSWSEFRPPDTSGMHILSGASDVNIAIDTSGNLYAGGYFSDTNGNYKCILKWDGKKWSKLENYPNQLNQTANITDLQTDKYGNVYASGSFTDSSSIVYSMAKWDGKNWIKLPGSAADYISNFCVSDDGNIYAFGAFNGSKGYYIANYNLNTSYNWAEVKNPDSTGFDVPGANVFISLATDSKNNLFVNGYFTNAAGKRYVAKWDEKNWSEFGVTDNLGYDLTVDKQDNVYSSGSITFPNDCNVKKWNGNSWSGVGSPLTLQDVAPLGGLLATDPMGNIYSNAQSNEPGVGSFIVRYGAAEVGPPEIISFTPGSGSLGTKVLVTGKYFTGATSVKFGGTAASSFTVINDSTITATVAEGSTGSVFIQNPEGADSLQKFIYTCDSINKPIPVISSIGDSILLSTKANYYQWYFNNNKIANEIFESLHISNTGFYKVATSTNNLCWVSSLDYPIILNPNPLSDTLKVNLYPNPSTGNFTVDVKLPQTTTVVSYVTIYDVNGIQVLQTNKLIFFGSEIKIPITINTKGTFFVKVYVNGDSRQQVIIIM